MGGGGEKENITVSGYKLVCDDVGHVLSGLEKSFLDLV